MLTALGACHLVKSYSPTDAAPPKDQTQVSDTGDLATETGVDLTPDLAPDLPPSPYSCPELAACLMTCSSAPDCAGGCDLAPNPPPEYRPLVDCHTASNCGP